MEPILIVSMVLLWVMVVLNLLLTLGLARRIDARLPKMDSQRPALLDVGTPVPDFTAQTLEGETVTRSTYAGSAMAFVFVSPDCTPCREAIPTLEALRRRAERSRVGLVLVSDSDAATTEALTNEFESGLPILVAPRKSNPFFSDYRVSATPSYYLVDAGGKVAAGGLGVFELKEQLDGFLRQTRSNVVEPDVARPAVLHSNEHP